MEGDREKSLKKFCKTIFEEQLDEWYRAKELWPRDRSIKAFKELFIEPGSPWENGYCESFNGKLRDECLNGQSFTR